jgi:hypothetical protein
MEQWKFVAHEAFAVLKIWGKCYKKVGGTCTTQAHCWSIISGHGCWSKDSQGYEAWLRRKIGTTEVNSYFLLWYNNKERNFKHSIHLFLAHTAPLGHDHSLWALGHAIIIFNIYKVDDFYLEVLLLYIMLYALCSWEIFWNSLFSNYTQARNKVLFFF